MIIGFTGLAGSGKTTATDYLCENHNFVKIGFKDALVEEMKERFPQTLMCIHSLTADGSGTHVITEEDIDDLFVNKPQIMRRFMQEYGTDVRRGDDPNYWTKRWLHKVSIALENGLNVCVDDVRFRNEADEVRLQQGHIIRIARNDINVPDGHSSETEQSEIEHDLEIKCGKGEHDKLYRMIDLYLEENERQTKQDGIRDSERDG